MLNFETTTEMLGPLIGSPGPSENQKPDGALVALEYHHDVGASPAPDTLVVNPGPPENQEPNAAASPSPNPLAFGSLVLSTGPPENQKFNIAAIPAPVSRVLSPGPPENQGPDAAASPSPNPLAFGSLVLSTGPPENQEFDNAASPTPVSRVLSPGSLVLGTGPQENQEFDDAARLAPEPLATGQSENLMEPNALSPLQNLPTPQLNFNSAIQNNSRRSPTPQLDMRKLRAKRQHSGDTGDKARLIPQDILTTRVAIQEKDNMIELLKNEVSG
jgi:hypothetical protein